MTNMRLQRMGFGPRSPHTLSPDTPVTPEIAEMVMELLRQQPTGPEQSPIAVEDVMATLEQAGMMAKRGMDAAKPPSLPEMAVWASRSPTLMAPVPRSPILEMMGQMALGPTSRHLPRTVPDFARDLHAFGTTTAGMAKAAPGLAKDIALAPFTASQRTWERISKGPEGNWKQWAPEQVMDLLDMIPGTTAEKVMATGGMGLLEAAMIPVLRKAGHVPHPTSHMMTSLPRKTPGFEFEYEDMYKALKPSPVGAQAARMASVNPMRHNQIHGELAAAYHLSKGKMPFDDVEQIFMGTLNRNPEGKTIFGDIWDGAVRDRIHGNGEFLDDLDPTVRKVWGGKKGNYQEITQNIGSQTENLKTAGEIRALDTSRGCKNFCNECYAQSLAKVAGLDFPNPKKVTLTGDFLKLSPSEQKSIWRIGTSGEPNWNPNTNKMDWAWTNEQIRNVNLHVPEAQGQLFLITKLQSLENFDPTVMRNLEISVDPFNPEHFFKTMKNVETLKEMDPTINLTMRIRSVSTQSDEINALQKIAVDFANKHDLSVLETRMRFKSGEGLERVLPAPDYFSQGGGQALDKSYFPKNYAKQTAGGEFDRKHITTFEDHLESGERVKRQTTVRADKSLFKGRQVGQIKEPIFEIWVGDRMVGQGLKREDALAKAQDIANAETGRMSPTRPRVRELTKETSSLSQFGVKRHYICNAENKACGTCQNCRAFLKFEKKRAADAPKIPQAPTDMPAVPDPVKRVSGSKK